MKVRTEIPTGNRNRTLILITSQYNNTNLMALIIPAYKCVYCCQIFFGTFGVFIWRTLIANDNKNIHYSCRYFKVIILNATFSVRIKISIYYNKIFSIKREIQSCCFFFICAILNEIFFHHN